MAHHHVALCDCLRAHAGHKVTSQGASLLRSFSSCLHLSGLSVFFLFLLYYLSFELVFLPSEIRIAHLEANLGWLGAQLAVFGQGESEIER